MSSARTRKRPTRPADLLVRIGPEPRLRLAAFILTAICLLGLFSTEISDTDFWWHLKTGQYLVQRHALPVPDPFAYTSALGEDQVSHFNLTHEWLSQALLYFAYIAGGFPTVILIRAALLTAVCTLAGFLAGRALKNVYVGIAAAFLTSAVAVEFRADRPTLVTFLCVAVFITLLELRVAISLLPPLALVWANCHGGFFLGWMVLLAYCAEWRTPDRKRLWLVTGCSIAASGINPNAFNVLSTLFQYRRSEMTANLLEWSRPSLWGPPYAFDILTYATVLVLALSWRKVRMTHWILFALFASASIVAFRNILFIGFLAPFLIAAYWPFRFPASTLIAWTTLLFLAIAIAVGIARGSFFQLRVADWTIPKDAADYLADNHITGPLFNTYEQGGYLIWRGERVFIDGRALSESVYRDYRQILFNRDSLADQIAGPRAALLEQYGVQVVVMNALDFASGALYPLALALANPSSQEWQLVYEDQQDLIFTRSPGAQGFSDKLRRVLTHLDTECTAYVEHSPDTPLCARTLADYWLRNGVKDRARRMLQLYLGHAVKPDPQAEQILQQLGLH
jgi:hypothetical protein